MSLQNKILDLIIIFPYYYSSFPTGPTTPQSNRRTVGLGIAFRRIHDVAICRQTLFIRRDHGRWYAVRRVVESSQEVTFGRQVQ